MPERLSRATVATCAVLAGVAFGGAYALAHDGPGKPAPAPAPPAAIRLADKPVGALHRVSPLPALIVPRPKPTPTPAQPQAVVTVPAPAPKPRRPAPAKPPVTFDDSG